ncbi:MULTISPECIES: ABC transporter permease [Streptomyces]|uniref:ABC transporter permease n=1 Tax=Streptomyces eurythermus TaxID=42237 RepID=A0ABW6YRY1_9ACTN|nr:MULTISPECIES: ABC transporter permease [Streptomyces]QIS71916.1 ABC transporter permease [Streptomyces sp. DSM 40868]WDM11464.1 ABC transporter permease [Streptomyces lavenduligriseus]
MSMSLTAPSVRRLRALARAELTLLGRNRGVVVTALLVPLLLPFSVRPALDHVDLEKQGISVGSAMLTAGIGFSFLFAVYSALVNAYVARREELVLKRLRTGEPTDAEILAGTALPTLTVGLAQSLVLCAGCVALLDAGAPEAPYLTLLGLVAGLVLSAALAALTATVTRTVESGQVTALPLVFGSMLGSGIMVPTEVMPEPLASVCELLPLSPAIRLVRGGWTGQLSAYEALGALATALAWTVVAVVAVRRWFRWEPRR